MYSFPPYMPVKPDNMNYVSAVYGVVVTIIIVDWFVRGRRQYRGQVARHGEAVQVLHQVTAATNVVR
ncbi:MAG: hypothetical protein Q9214_005317 [Letrouitia sp. 1 TL-2023]